MTVNLRDAAVAVAVAVSDSLRGPAAARALLVRARQRRRAARGRHRARLDARRVRGAAAARDERPVHARAADAGRLHAVSRRHAHSTAARVVCQYRYRTPG